MVCERCRGRGEIINDRGVWDACPECAEAAEREYSIARVLTYGAVEKIDMGRSENCWAGGTR